MKKNGTILVATDLCPRCLPAARYAIDKAEREKLDIHFVHGAFNQGNPDNLPPKADATDAELTKRLDKWIQSLGLDPSNTSSMLVRANTLAEAILQAADYVDCDLIITGQERESWAGLFNGDRIAKGIISLSHIPITIVK